MWIVRWLRRERKRGIVVFAELGRTGLSHRTLPRMTDRTNMTDQERQTAEALLSRIEIAVGEIQDRRENAALIKAMIESLNGLRSLLSVVRSH